MFGGAFLSQWMPINKNLWTVPFAIFMAGMSQLIFAACYWIIDVLECRRWAQPLAVYGMNAITVYVLSGVLARSLGLIESGGVSLKTILYSNILVPLFPPPLASALYGLLNVAVLYAVADLMYRRKWFVRF